MTAGGDANETYKTNLKTLYKFTSSLFDREDQAWKAAMIIQGILKARSPRITEVARAIPKGFFAGQKMIYRFLKRAPLKEALLRMLPEDAPFVICDPTEILRPQAKRTPTWAGSRTGRPGGSIFWSSLSLQREGHPILVRGVFIPHHLPGGNLPEPGACR